MQHASERPSRQFPEGITLLLEPDGLVIRVDDYHARPLKLSWKELEALQREARSVRRSGQGGSTG